MHDKKRHPKPSILPQPFLTAPLQFLETPSAPNSP
jgi:hypothetical protein